MQLAADLKAAEANVWLDQLDIKPGKQWDLEIERALANCVELLVILSPAAVESRNVMDEVAFALEEGKNVIPVICSDCRIPFRLRRLQYVDFKLDYAGALSTLRTALSSGRYEEVVEDPVVPPDADLPAVLTERLAAGSGAIFSWNAVMGVLLVVAGMAFIVGIVIAIVHG